MGFANGVLDAFTTPALRGVLPELVAKTQPRQANSLLGSTGNAANTGRSVSGLLVIGIGIAIAFDALTFTSKRSATNDVTCTSTRCCHLAITSRKPNLLRDMLSRFGDDFGTR
jgi:hypothetical protein